MNHHQRKTLHAIFAHPLQSNLHGPDIEHTLTSLGAEISVKSGSRIGVSLNGHAAAFHRPGHSVPKQEVMEIRKFLETCGVTPDAYPV